MRPTKIQPKASAKHFGQNVRSKILAQQFGQTFRPNVRPATVNASQVYDKKLANMSWHEAQTHDERSTCYMLLAFYKHQVNISCTRPIDSWIFTPMLLKYFTRQDTCKTYKFVHLLATAWRRAQPFGFAVTQASLPRISIVWTVTTARDAECTVEMLRQQNLL